MSSEHLPSRVQKALVDPRAAMEVRLWLNPQAAARHAPDHPLRDPARRKEITALRQEAMRQWRGGVHGETGLHWAALADRGLMIDLVALGLDPNGRDASNRTPMDWLNDRAWMILVEGKGHTDQLGKEKLKLATEDLLATLWGLGGRPAPSSMMEVAGRLPTGYTWARAGLWGAVSLLKGNGGVEGLRQWTPQGAGFLHAWILGPEGEEKAAALADALRSGLDIEEEDQAGRTALWYAVDAWIAQPQWEAHLRDAIAMLLANGADPEHPDQDGATAETLPAIRGATPEVEAKIAAALQGALVPAPARAP